MQIETILYRKTRGKFEIKMRRTARPFFEIRHRVLVVNHLRAIHPQVHRARQKFGEFRVA